MPVESQVNELFTRLDGLHGIPPVFVHKIGVWQSNRCGVGSTSHLCHEVANSIANHWSGVAGSQPSLVEADESEPGGRSCDGHGADMRAGPGRRQRFTICLPFSSLGHVPPIGAVPSLWQEPFPCMCNSLAREVQTTVLMTTAKGTMVSRQQPTTARQGN